MNTLKFADNLAGETIVRRLDEFPELTQAVREGDLLRISTLCAQLFEWNSHTRIPPQQPPIAS